MYVSSGRTSRLRAPSPALLVGQRDARSKKRFAVDGEEGPQGLIVRQDELEDAVYAVYAISSLDTGVPLRPHPRATIVGTYQAVAGLAPRLFTLDTILRSKTGVFSHYSRDFA